MIPPDLRAAYAAAHAITRRHARSFHFASIALPAVKRQHAYALYAYCRYLDDAIDRASDPAAAAETLGTFTRRICTGQATPPDRSAHPWLPAFEHTIRQCALPTEWLLDLLHGVCLDREPLQLANEEDLSRYCYYVAGVVGLMMTRIFGLTDTSHEPRAVELGEAMQRTNILRDVAEDLRMGRIYLPASSLARYGLDADFLRRGQVTPAWRDFMRDQISRARAFYAACTPGIRALPDDGSQRTVRLMQTIYGAILDEIERADYDVFSARRAVSFPRKCLLAARVWWKSAN